MFVPIENEYGVVEFVNPNQISHITDFHYTDKDNTPLLGCTLYHEFNQIVTSKLTKEKVASIFNQVMDR